MPVADTIHPWMRGYLLLRDSPYMAKTDSDGKFVIKNLPVGEHVFQTWHEKSGYLKEAEFTSVKADKKGRLNVTITPGKNDVGVARLSIQRFDRN